MPILDLRKIIYILPSAIGFCLGTVGFSPETMGLGPFGLGAL